MAFNVAKAETVTALQGDVDNITPDGGVKAVGKGELLINIMDAPYGASPTASASANTTAINAAIAAATANGGTVYIPPFTFPTAGITSNVSGLTMRGAGRNKSKITSSISNVFTLSGGTVMISDIGFTSGTGGGHTMVVAPGTTLSQSHFSECSFVQNNDGKSIWYFNDVTAMGGGFFDVHWDDCLFQHTLTATVAGFFGYSNANNFFSANRFTRCRCSNSGTFFFDIQLDAAGTFNYNNTWDTINFEVCDGGGIRMWSANNTGIHNIGFFDNNTTTNNLIEFGRSATTPSRNQSRGNRITNYHRSGGTLGTGFVDILLRSGQNSGNTTFEGISGTSTAGVTIDLGTSSGYATVVGHDPAFVTVLNAVGTNTLMMTATNGLYTPSININGVDISSGTSAPEGVVVGTPGDLYTRISGSGGLTASRLYVKETGTGTNTGWKPVNSNLQLFPPELYGAVGDGTTDDTAAIQAAITAALAAGGKVTLAKNKTYATTAFSVSANGVLEGNGSTLKCISPAGTLRYITLAANSTLRGCVVDCQSIPTTSGVWATAVDNVLIDNCTVKNLIAGDAIAYQSVTNSTIKDSIADTCFVGVHVYNLSSFITLRDVHVKNWQQRGIYVAASSTQAPTDIDILHCLVDNLVSPSPNGATVREPYQITGNAAAKIQRIRVEDCKAIGPGHSYTDTTTPGTADQFNASNIDGLMMRNNISMYGGDCGFSGALNTMQSHIGNLAAYNDTAGIAVGGTTGGCNIVTVNDNQCLNNHQNKFGDRQIASGPGIYLYGATNVTLTGNNCSDNQATPTQAFGIYSHSGSGNIIMSGNIANGVTFKQLFVDDTTGTNLQIQDTPGTAIPTTGIWFAAQRVKNSAPAVGQPKGWICTASGGLYTKTWATSTAFTAGDWVLVGTRVMLCVISGTSGTGSTPTGSVGTQVTDGTVTWLVMSSSVASFASEGNL